MIRNKGFSLIAAVLAAVLLLTLLSGCGRSKAAAAQPDPVLEPASVSTPEPAAQPEAESASGRQDGERFEDVIILEGMEETVKYEHVKNAAIGFEMDYDYALFERRSGSDRECFVSIYDDPQSPENYLEVTYSAMDAETAAASVRAALSQEYELLEGTRALARAGSCLWIEAAVLKGTNNMADQLQAVYIIPAPDGCRIAAAHYAAEAAEGFGRRFSYMLNTLTVIDSQADRRLAGTWQTASMSYADDGTMQPEYYVRFTDTEIVYGHMMNGAFVSDHADAILRLVDAPAGGVRLQAQASNGVQYTYQTCESDSNVLEYYETWRAEEFSETYRGGASLSRNG